MQRARHSNLHRCAQRRARWTKRGRRHAGDIFNGRHYTTGAKFVTKKIQTCHKSVSLPQFVNRDLTQNGARCRRFGMFMHETRRLSSVVCVIFARRSRAIENRRHTVFHLAAQKNGQFQKVRIKATMDDCSARRASFAQIVGAEIEFDLPIFMPIRTILLSGSFHFETERFIKRMIQAILFDFNGVIINDEPLQMRAYQEVLRSEGINLTEAEYYSALGTDDVEFVRRAFARVGRGEELNDERLRAILERKIAKHHELVSDGALPLFPGVVDFIKACRRAEYTLGIVSMARRSEVEYVFARAGLARCFDAVVTAEDVTVCKPNPQCYQIAFRRADAAHQKKGRYPLMTAECLVIEDAPPGVRAGRAAGMRALGITNTVTAEELRAAGAEVVTKSLADWTTDAVNLVFK
jgi:beta-phosphoglucomutase